MSVLTISRETSLSRTGTEGEGFEPPGLLTQLFSRQPQSSTLPSLRIYYTTGNAALEGGQLVFHPKILLSSHSLLDRLAT